MIKLIIGVSPSKYLHELVQIGLYELCNKLKEVRLQKEVMANDEVISQ